jgi:hypothetical protein
MFDLGAQGLAGPDEMLLTNVFIERPRTHAIGQGASAIAGIIAVRSGLKQTHKSFHHGDTEARKNQ